MSEPIRRQVVAYVKLYGLPDHPLANVKGEVYEHRSVLYDKIGPGSHPCHFCGATVTWNNRRGKGQGSTKGDLHTEHLDGDPLNNEPANLVPACSSCNIKHGFLRSRIKPGEPMIVKPNGSRTRAISATCPQCGKEFLAPPSSKQTYCSRGCSDVAKVVDHCIRGHIRTPENTYTWRGRVQCRQCMNVAYKAYRARKKSSA